MVICVCNNLNEGKILKAKQAGAKSPHQAYQFLGCAVKCGTCCKEACVILKG
jgi:bacterioferritin-associated ferredoxin